MKNLDLSDVEVEGIIQLLELQPCDSVGQLRDIDKICNKLEIQKEGNFNFEEHEFNLIKNKLMSFGSFNPQKKYRQIILELINKVESSTNIENGKQTS
jgi:hypothetical protein